MKSEPSCQSRILPPVWGESFTLEDESTLGFRLFVRIKVAWPCNNLSSINFKSNVSLAQYRKSILFTNQGSLDLKPLNVHSRVHWHFSEIYHLTKLNVFYRGYWSCKGQTFALSRSVKLHHYSITSLKFKLRSILLPTHLPMPLVHSLLYVQECVFCISRAICSLQFFWASVDATCFQGGGAVPHRASFDENLAIFRQKLLSFHILPNMLLCMSVGFIRE